MDREPRLVTKCVESHLVKSVRCCRDRRSAEPILTPNAVVASATNVAWKGLPFWYVVAGNEWGTAPDS